MYNLDENPDLNITPLVDIMLVLLAVLMVSMPVLSYEEKVDIPDGSKRTVSAKQSASVKISVLSKNNIFINNTPTNIKDFPDMFLNQTRGVDKKTHIAFSIDKKLPYGDAVYIITTVTKNGFDDISLITK